MTFSSSHGDAVVADVVVDVVADVVDVVADVVATPSQGPCFSAIKNSRNFFFFF